MRLSTRVFIRAELCFLLWTSGVTAALAQDGAAQQTDSTELKEIVVTAERREATVQTTPISITALSGADLQLEGITSAQGIATRVPDSRSPQPVRETRYIKSVALPRPAGNHRRSDFISMISQSRSRSAPHSAKSRLIPISTICNALKCYVDRKAPFTEPAQWGEPSRW